MASRSTRYRAGDLGRVLRENLRVVRGRVALVTVTGPGRIEVCPCCHKRPVRLLDAAAVSAWNLGESRAWRRFAARLRTEMWRRHGMPPPRAVVRVSQRQKRGVDHLHLVMLCATPDQLLRVQLWVLLYRELHAEYGFGFVDDPERVDRSGRTRLFDVPAVCGVYLGKYLQGGQLERFLEADDRSWSAVWVSPELKRRSGWTLERCRWVRQGWAIREGRWSRRTWYGRVWLPSWWYSDSHRAWVLAVLGWDGVTSGAAVPLHGSGQGAAAFGAGVVPVA